MDSTMIVVDGQHLVDTEVFAGFCEQEDQSVIDYLARVVVQGGVPAYSEQGELLGRADLIPDEDGYYSKFFINPDELRRYFADARGDESELAYTIEGVLAQI